MILVKDFFGMQGSCCLSNSSLPWGCWQRFLELLKPWNYLQLWTPYSVDPVAPHSRHTGRLWAPGGTRRSAAKAADHVEQDLWRFQGSTAVSTLARNHCPFVRGQGNISTSTSICTSILVFVIVLVLALVLVWALVLAFVFVLVVVRASVFVLVLVLVWA